MNRIIFITLLVIALIGAGIITYIATQDDPPAAPDLAAIAKHENQKLRSLPPQKTAFKKGRRWIIHLQMPAHSNPAYTDYCKRLLGLILNRTVKDYGSYRVNVVESTNTTDSLVQDITDDTVDISVLNCTASREKDLHAVRIPILRGLAAYHIFLIPEQQQEAFSSTHSLKQLQSLQAGLVHGNPITPAMQAAGLAVQEFSTNALLHKKFTDQKIDDNKKSPHYSLIPITDLFMDDAKPSQDAALRIEKRLCLVCPNPIYFYVGKQDSLLHERLVAGFERSLFDGSFERLFNSCYTECIDKALLDGRRLLRIPNPELPPETPFQQRGWWYEPDGL